MAGLAVWLLGLALPAEASGWRTCAREGEICQLDSRGVVRYGIDGQWSSRVLSGRVECSNALFGDPAPQTPKRCEVRDSSFGGSGGSSDSNWVFCAAEGEICRFRGSSEVRFGTDQRYTARRAYSSVRCDVQAFGDPIYGQTKHCEVPASAALTGSGNQGDWGGSGDSQAWRYCAGEGQTCFVKGRAEVRFGDGRRFASRTVRNSTVCNTSVFGDPAYGVIKHCEVRAASFGGSGDGGVADGGWIRCAGEGERCDVGSSRTQVRFGTRGRYAYRDVYGGVGCDIQAFGHDPVPGSRKQCEVRR